MHIKLQNNGTFLLFFQFNLKKTAIRLVMATFERVKFL